MSTDRSKNMANQEISTISTVDVLFEMMQQDIFSGVFSPGSRITERELTDRYNVSRNTARESIVTLLANGLLIKEPNKGVYVRSLSMDDVRELFNLRFVLESEAIKYITASGVIPPELFRLADQILDLTEKNDEYNHISADIRFHEKLIESSGSRRLMRLYWDIVSEIKLAMYQSLHYVPFKKDNALSHNELLKAMENNNVNGALNILNNHFSTAISNFEIAYAYKDKLNKKENASR